MRISAAGMFGNSPKRDFGFVRAFAQTMEGLGFHALSVPEHVVFFASYESKYPYSDDGSTRWSPDTGIYDPLFVVQAAAAATTTLRFVTGVLILPERPALLTAKEVLTLDHVTGGRFELGVGSGWSWEEYAALGVPFEQRGKRLDEYIEAIRVAWTQERASYHGEFVNFDDVVLNPKPLTPGGPPIIIGGDSVAAMRRAARLGDGWYGWWAQPDIEAHLEQLHAAMADAGRSVSDPDFSFKLGVPLATESPDEIAALADRARGLGVDELILAGPGPTKTFESVLTSYADACGLR
ncbi:MAG: TIGR03619 family F420-dependent LLM class oxidoreductase [Actinomycetota bacterium]|nr:TIGR03619 family F420-dependent LLM class oxidoreductase [Actinomycetota bacterium]